MSGKSSRHGPLRQPLADHLRREAPGQLARRLDAAAVDHRVERADDTGTVARERRSKYLCGVSLYFEWVAHAPNSRTERQAVGLHFDLAQ